MIFSIVFRVLRANIRRYLTEKRGKEAKIAPQGRGARFNQWLPIAAFTLRRLCQLFIWVLSSIGVRNPVYIDDKDDAAKSESLISASVMPLSVILRYLR